MYSPLRFTFTFLSSVCWQPATTTQNNESGPSIHISSLYWRWHSTTNSRAASGAERSPGEEGERAQKGHSLYTIFTSNRCYISIHCTQYLHLLYTIFTFTIHNIYSQEQHWGNPTGSLWVHKLIAKDILIKQYLHPIRRKKKRSLLVLRNGGCIIFLFTLNTFSASTFRSCQNSSPFPCIQRSLWFCIGSDRTPPL